MNVCICADLRTVEGELCSTYKEACLRLQLLEDDAEWVNCLAEAAETKPAATMRHLFVTIIVFCHPADIPSLFHTNQAALSEDFQRQRERQGFRGEHLQTVAANDLACDLHNRLVDQGADPRDFPGLPQADFRQRNEADIGQDDLDHEAAETFSRDFQLLNKEQREVFEKVQAKLDHDQGGLFFIDAPGM